MLTTALPVLALLRALYMALEPTPDSPGPRFLLVSNSGSRQLWTGDGLPWGPSSARDADALVGQGPRRGGAAGPAHRPSRRYRRRRHEGPPAPPSESVQRRWPF